MTKTDLVDILDHISDQQASDGPPNTFQFSHYLRNTEMHNANYHTAVIEPAKQKRKPQKSKKQKAPNDDPQGTAQTPYDTAVSKVVKPKKKPQNAKVRSSVPNDHSELMCMQP